MDDKFDDHDGDAFHDDDHDGDDDDDDDDEQCFILLTISLLDM